MKTKDIFYSLDKQGIKWSQYFDVYDRHLEKYVGKKPVVVEVGILQGGGMEMWKKYFGDGATIIGIDTDYGVFNYQVEGCEYVIGNQESSAFWEEFFKTHSDIDVFIDDGGHTMPQQINTLSCVWNHIKPGGIYICEDTHTSYQKDWGGSFRGGSFIEYAKRVTDSVNYEYFKDQPINQHDKAFCEFYSELTSIHFYDSMVVLEKDKKVKPEWADSKIR